MSGIGQIDKNLAVPGVINEENLAYYNVRNEPFSVYGLLPGAVGEPFCRIPRKVAERVNAGVLRLHRNTAGGRVRFRTNSSCVAIRAKMPGKCLMPHMPFLGSSGFDLYVINSGAYQYKGSFIPPINRSDVFESIVKFDNSLMKEIVIHFPLYDNVEELLIGVEQDALIEKGNDYRLNKPVVFYGSSITQCGCVSRPGNGYTNLISQKLDLDHVNLGFSGNACGEKSMAEYISEQPMSLFFMDYDHNSVIPQLEANHETFFLTIREKNPNLPIILATRTLVPRTAQMAQERDYRRKVIYRTYENALKRGDKNVKFIDGSTVYSQAEQLGVAADSCTVDGVHPNDLGFACMAKTFGKAISQMI